VRSCRRSPPTWVKPRRHITPNNDLTLCSRTRSALRN